MVARARHLVEKRDGRHEGLRATKLARSIWLAVEPTGERCVERAMPVCEEVLRRASATPCTSTAELACLVEEALLAARLEAAARAYSRIGSARRHRRPLAVRRGGVE